jgi:hydrogenase-4 component B
LIVQTLCLLASFQGGASAAAMLLSGRDSLVLKSFESSIPYISISMTLDALSAFFILILSILAFCVSIYSIGYTAHYHGKRNVGAFHFLYATFLLSMVFVFTADNAVFFFMAWSLWLCFPISLYHLNRNGRKTVRQDFFTSL